MAAVAGANVNGAVRANCRRREPRSNAREALLPGPIRIYCEEGTGVKGAVRVDYRRGIYQPAAFRSARCEAPLGRAGVSRGAELTQASVGRIMLEHGPYRGTGNRVAERYARQLCFLRGSGAIGDCQ